MTTTATKERVREAPKEVLEGLMPHGSKTLVSVKLAPPKAKTTMREQALLFYQSCVISTRNILKKLISLI